MEKKGMSHIEAILSFVIFTVAIVAALIFFNPGDPERLIDSTLTYSFNEIQANTSTELQTFSIKINNENIEESTEIITIKINNIEGNKISKVTTQQGESMESQRQEENININPLTDWSNVNFITLQLSEEFQENQVPAGTYNEDYYEISTSEKKQIVSEKKFEELARYYRFHYQELRQAFNLPRRTNFQFSLEFSSEDKIEVAQQIPDSLESFSDSKRIEVIRETGEITFATLKVTLW